MARSNKIYKDFKMADGNFALNFAKELVVDLFAGGGGASLGIARAYRHPDVAVNHNPIAIAAHRANHPDTEHYVADVFEVDPYSATRGRPVGILWASPDCRHHSKAKGGKPRSIKIRGLAWIIVRWAYVTRPRLIFWENVEEFCDWGPLDDQQQPIKAERGRTFKAFAAVLSTGLAADHPDMPEILREIGQHVPLDALVRGLGYKIDWRELVAADHGVPTIRKRLYGVARCDGRPIVFPEVTRMRDATTQGKRWRMAAECINFDDLGRSIFDREKPLAPNSERRIAKGCWRHVLTKAQPFIVGVGGRMEQSPTRGIDQPAQTITAKADAALCAPVMIQAAHGEGKPGGVQRWGHGSRDIELPLGTVTGSGGHAVAGVELAPFLTEYANASTQRTFDIAEPLRTQVAQVKGGHFAMAAAHLTHLTHHGERAGHACDEPMRTVTGANRGEQALVAAHLTAMAQNVVGSSLEDPLATVMAGATRHAMVASFLEQANAGFYEGGGRSLDAPMSTVTSSGSQQQLVSAYLVKYYGEGGQWQGVDEPTHTLPTKGRMGLVQVVQVAADILPPEQLAKAKRCAAFLHKHLPEHFAEPADLVLVGGYVLVDITLRMLQPDELKRAQGFPADYILNRGLFFNADTGASEWKPITKTDQVKLIGNSVCPDMAELLVRANAADLIHLYDKAAA
ncbi:DNA cytosine methyltransferase [Xanthomonas campestris pv. raphani]|uniref:DNA cytosine methyltransferase n=1 Tax=Xanthomonas campestris TaxID=339 RepID=UPI002B226A60|nr:DNA cytosine methyltransferase [Xanthomonas campestris]MEA9759737.1 DNA cytosine methyltransferase [Xanthomonas campestris pv. raphani]